MTDDIATEATAAELCWAVDELRRVDLDKTREAHIASVRDLLAAGHEGWLSADTARVLGVLACWWSGNDGRERTPTLDAVELRWLSASAARDVVARWQACCAAVAATLAAYDPAAADVLRASRDVERWHSTAVAATLAAETAAGLRLGCAPPVNVAGVAMWASWPAAGCAVAVTGDRATTLLGRDGPLTLTLSVSAAHEAWTAAYDLTGEVLPHPLSPVAREMPRVAEIEHPHHHGGRAILPRFQQDQDSAELPLWPTPAELVPVGDTLPLPGMGGRHGTACPSWLLTAYDATGKHELVGGGRGAPVTLRAWIAPMLHLGVEDRLCGGVVILRPTWAELVSWIWARPPKLRDPDRWRSYMAQISAVSAVRIPVVIDGLPYWRAPVLVVGDLPGRYPGPSWAAEHRVTLRIQMPPAAAHGPRLSFPTLREYGSRSAALYRAYLTATAVMDHAARKGQPVTAKHPERARQRVPDWNADKLARIIGLSPHRENRRRALEAWQQLAADGVIELVETAPGRWGIYSPQQAQQAADIR